MSQLRPTSQNTELPAYERLGVFYLGREQDVMSGRQEVAPLLYDSKDLTTHAVIVGMTGSGKTGLGITLLEEAAIDGIPSIVIDPKGDMGNLLLRFPDLKPADFEPWIEKEQAARKGMSVPEFARKTAKTWKEGLAEWDQSPDRITRFHDAAEVAVYTPGSDAGIPLAIIKSFDAPPEAVRTNFEAMQDAVSGAVGGLLTLLDIEPDPVRSREHILLSNILNHHWSRGENLTLPGLIREVQSPPFDTVGIMDLETIFPAKDRMALAMTINNVLASPGFAAWMQGQPLDVQKLLYTDEGKPRVAVVSIAHLGDRERMFFVTTLLGEVLSWMRSQSGTSSLRAILYMDEVYGYLPPSKNPPTKIPLLTMLKQARAFGLGLILATQNPVDLDYKALSNAGTWFVGRLQTERDKMRLLDGLEGASATAGQTFDRGEMERIISGVGNRVFLMNNVHDGGPVTFHVRWVLSYLAGPLTRAQIGTLMAPFKAVLAAPGKIAGSFGRAAEVSSFATESEEDHLPGTPHKPIVSDSVTEQFAQPQVAVRRKTQILYRPAVYARTRLHFIDSKSKTDVWRDSDLLDTLHDDGEAFWPDAEDWTGRLPDLDREPMDDARYGDLPGEYARKGGFSVTPLKNFLYQEARLPIYVCPDLKLYSRPDDREGDFRARLRDAARERRDLEVEKLRGKYETKFDRLQEKIRKADQKIDREQEQADAAKQSTWSYIGQSVLGAVFGKRVRTSSIGTAARSATRAADQKADVRRAKEDKRELEEDLRDLERELEDEIDALRDRLDDSRLKVETIELKPRKSDITVEEIGLVWLPWTLTEDGEAEPAYGVG